MSTTAKTKKIVETALLFAVAIILSFISVFHLPFGGSVTLCSMLPIIIISYRYGVKWGLFSAFVYSLFQIILGISDLKALTPLMLIGSILFDYILAYTVLGLGGIFRNKFKRPYLALLFGTIAGSLARYLSHFISGYIFFNQYAEWFFSQEGYTFGQKVLDIFTGHSLYLIYSAVYNGLYMIPEIILTAVVSVIIGFIPVISKKQ